MSWDGLVGSAFFGDGLVGKASDRLTATAASSGPAEGSAMTMGKLESMASAVTALTATGALRINDKTPWDVGLLDVGLLDTLRGMEVSSDEFKRMRLAEPFSGVIFPSARMAGRSNAAAAAAASTVTTLATRWQDTLDKVEAKFPSQGSAKYRASLRGRFGMGAGAAREEMIELLHRCSFRRGEKDYTNHARYVGKVERMVNQWSAELETELMECLASAACALSADATTKAEVARVQQAKERSDDMTLSPDLEMMLVEVAERSIGSAAEGVW